jgi:glycosyltransferase involved in cell wall biosynthesis
MKIAIIGTRGIPNNYGGFEQLAEYLSLGLVEKGHQVYVYSPHNHIYKESSWQGVNILHQYDPEYKLGTAGQFIYDLNCILDSRKHQFDIILQLGYTSSSIWGKLMPKHSLVITNMDGLEWKRTKFNSMVQRFVKYAEKLAIKYSAHFISDSIGIKNYLLREYGKQSTYIAYGAHLMTGIDLERIASYNLTPYSYDMLIARLEPENSIETILTGVTAASTERSFIVIGNHNSKYGEYLKEKFKDERIRFVGAEYNIQTLNNLRHFSNLYFHGHTVGGTNPSLLEAMASNCLICANDNEFNASILGKDGYYFRTSEDITRVMEQVEKNEYELAKIEQNRSKIEHEFSWGNIINHYERFFQECLNGYQNNVLNTAQAVR